MKTGIVALVAVVIVVLAVGGYYVSKWLMGSGTTVYGSTVYTSVASGQSSSIQQSSTGTGIQHHSHNHSEQQ